VTVAKPLQKEITEYLNFTGTTQAVGFVEVRARVSGVLESMHFEPGTHVDKDQLLFIIDPKPYQADLHAAEADLASAKAEYHRTQVELERADQLIKKKFISKTDHLRRQTEHNVAKATIGRMQAKVEKAQIKLGYTRVTAPIAGRVSRKMVDVGNLVGEGEATLLTTVTQNKPMYAYFHLNERDLLQIMQVHRNIIKEKGHNSDKLPDSDLGIPVYLGLANEDNYPQQGTMDFAESRVDTETGTIELRAIFPNQQIPPKLIAGLFTRIRLPVGTDPDALLVSERALSADQSGDYLLVVNKENIVEKRNVIRGQILDGLMAIDKGIQADDRVIINGLQRARPGVKVNPEEAEMTGEPTSIKPPDKHQATPENLQKNTGNGHPETADKG
jgi:RND family efflux transporter MFP subunit